MNLVEISRRLAELKEWALESNALVLNREFNGFKEAGEWINKVARQAEETGHHPSIMWDYNRVRLTLTTRETHELSEKDFEMAKAIDALG